MSAVDVRRSEPRLVRRRAAVAPNAVVAVLIFVVTEAMFFAALISALTIVRAGAGEAWPPPGQPRLPLEATALNTVALIASGLTMFLAGRAHGADGRRTALWMFGSLVLAGAFVAAQGAEWVALIREGLTLRSSNHGSFFYVIVGAHALHALVALGFLAAGWLRLRRGRLDPEWFRGLRIYWYFVVALWPLLYVRVYL